MTPERGVEFNSAPIPPREYLMRRSYNPMDVGIPGAVVREVRCAKEGTEHSRRAFIKETAPEWCPFCGSRMIAHSVDVPLVKSDGSGWS